jgi:hypothetical protein
MLRADIGLIAIPLVQDTLALSLLTPSRQKDDITKTNVHRKSTALLVDQEQILTEENYNILLYSTWSNASCDYVNTGETFQTVPLHSTALDEAIDSVQLPAAISNAFSSDQKYLCEVMKTNIPILPIHGQGILQVIPSDNAGKSRRAK